MIEIKLYTLHDGGVPHEHKAHPKCPNLFPTVPPGTHEFTLIVGGKVERGTLAVQPDTPVVIAPSAIRRILATGEGVAA